MEHQNSLSFPRYAALWVVNCMKECSENVNYLNPKSSRAVLWCEWSVSLDSRRYTTRIAFLITLTLCKNWAPRPDCQQLLESHLSCGAPELPELSTLCCALGGQLHERMLWKLKLFEAQNFWNCAMVWLVRIISASARKAFHKSRKPLQSSASLIMWTLWFKTNHA